MSVIIFLIPITLALGLIGVGFFLWTLKSKQYDDLQGAANRILFEEETQKTTKEEEKKEEEKH